MDDLHINLDSVLGLGRMALTCRLGTEEPRMMTLPQVHLILYRDTDPDGKEIITGICLEFGLVHSNTDQNKTFNGLNQMCIDFLENSIKGKNEEEIIKVFLELVEDRKIEDLWEIYRKINFRTALKGAPTVDALKFDRIAQLEVENRALRDRLKSQNQEVSPTVEELQRVTTDRSFLTLVPEKVA